MSCEENKYYYTHEVLELGYRHSLYQHKPYERGTHSFEVRPENYKYIEWWFEKNRKKLQQEEEKDL